MDKKFLYYFMILTFFLSSCIKKEGEIDHKITVGQTIELARDVNYITLELNRHDVLFGAVSKVNTSQEMTVLSPSKKDVIFFAQPEEKGENFTLVAQETGTYKFKVKNNIGSLTFVKVFKAPENPKIKYGIPVRGQAPLLDQFIKDKAVGNVKAEQAFWKNAEQQGFPLVTKLDNDKSYMTFLWQGKQDYSVEIMGVKRSRTNPMDNLLSNIKGTNIWFKTFEVPNNVESPYVFMPNVGQFVGTKNRENYYRALRAAAIHDPLNDEKWKRRPVKNGYESLARGPEAKQAYWSVEKENTPIGKTVDKTFKSNILNNSRVITIYRPSGVDIAKDIPVVFIFDGERYSRHAKTPFTLDNLIHEKKIPPVIAVFVHNTIPSTRGAELPCTVNFTNFLADELLPWVRKEVPETKSSTDIVVAGSSYGGLASACANIFRPEIFNHVLSQSGSYWWYPKKPNSLNDGKEGGWVVRRYMEKGCNGAKFYFDAGVFEGEEGTISIGGTAISLNNLMKEKGCQVTYHQFPGGHDLYHWKETIAYGLIALLGEK